MDKKKSRNITAPRFICQSNLVLFNASLVDYNCYAVRPNKPCNETCAHLNAKVPDYKEFMALNMAKLIRECETIEYCNLVIDVTFDFAIERWQSSNQQLDSLTWRSHEYPRLNDMLIVCSLVMSSALIHFSGEPTPYFCTFSSSKLDNKRTDYFNWKLNHDLAPIKAYYLCESDPLDYKSLKLGTFDRAIVDCYGRLMTPNLCDDTTKTRDQLTELFKQAQRVSQFDLASRFMWTGTKRYNETHFHGEKWINTTQLDNCVWNRRRN